MTECERWIGRRGTGNSRPSFEQRADAAMTGDQCLGLRLGVAAGDGEGKEILDQLMVEQRLRAAVEQALAKPRPVAG